MNTKLTIKKATGEYLQHVIFNDQQTMDDFIELLATQHPYGKPAYDEVIQTEGLSNTIIHHDAEYILEIIDMTAEIQAQQDSKDALDYLQATDFHVIKMMELGIPMPEGMSLLRAEARLRIVR